MVNKKNNSPANSNNDMDELLRMLDSMEGRNLDEDVEDTIRKFGYVGTPATPYIPPEKSFTPSGDVSDLSQLLIDPNDTEEDMGEEALLQMSQLLQNTTDEDMTEDLPPSPEQRNNPWLVLWNFFTDNWPRRGEPPLTIARKCGFWVSLVALLAAVSFLIVNIGIQPQMNQQLNNELVGLYQPDDDTEKGNCTPSYFYMC